MRKVERWCYTWLPIIFGCHQKASRSFFFRGKQFPICARCTGELIGMIFGFFVPFSVKGTEILLCLLFLVPMLIDGFAQKLTSYESTNIKRIFTGFFFGVGIVGLFIISTKYTYNSGIQFWAGKAGN